MATDYGILWTDPWLTPVGRIGMHLSLNDLTPYTTVAVITYDCYIRAKPGTQAILRWRLFNDTAQATLIAPFGDYKQGKVGAYYTIPASPNDPYEFIRATWHQEVNIFSGAVGHFGVELSIQLPGPTPTVWTWHLTTPARPPFVPPSTMPAPILSYVPPTTIHVSFSAPAPGSSAITHYDIQYTTDPSFVTGVTLVSTTLGENDINSLLPGNTYYVRVRAVNGTSTGAWSAASALQIIAGPRVRWAGVYRSTIAYVKVAGVWRPVITYAKSGGVWRSGGG